MSDIERIAYGVLSDSVSKNSRRGSFASSTLVEDPDNLNLLNGIIQQNAQLIKQNLVMIDILTQISLNMEKFLQR